ncbi:meiosis-specific protein MEI4 isoform X3 [Megalobrama amblycephala]|uniref:meiosis-specific protein MEI4 isoform X3 n=1 Tax=Megalobrama amblycephala TaxID=75352 RepID=UPI002014825B|nr:meiosis-specific protein MEI4 isoform X3 [Megalobrama amblycephala]
MSIHNVSVSDLHPNVWRRMEEKSASFRQGTVSWYIRISRLAVAVAVIKSKPSGGARQFAEALADRLRQQDEGWRSKAQGLHEDLLHVRQELLLTRLLFKTRSNTEPGQGQEIAKALSQDDPAAVNKGPCLPPTPPNSQNIPLQDRQWCQDHRMLKHMQFLQCLSGLRRVCELSLCRDGDVVWDSVVQLLDSVVEVFRQAHVGQPVHHPEQLHHATQTVAQTLSLGGTRHGCSVQHFSKVEDLLKEMISLLLTNQQFNAFSVHGVLLECLLALGGSCVLRTSFIQLLMSQTIQLAQQLWETCEKSGEELQHQMDWIRYQNSFYVFWLLEQLAQDTDCNVNQELVIHLETKALTLADEFPLFSLYMWRIGGLFRVGHQ